MAYPDIQMFIVIQVDQQQGQGLRIGRQMGRYKVVSPVFIVDHAAPAQVIVIKAPVLGLIGRQDKIQINITIQIGPGEGVGPLGRAEPI